MFAKMGLVNEIKSHSDDIRSVLQTEDLSGGAELLAKAGGNLKPVLKIYLDALSQMQGADRTLVKGKLAEMLNVVEKKSLGELKQYFST